MGGVLHCCQLNIACQRGMLVKLKESAICREIGLERSLFGVVHPISNFLASPFFQYVFERSLLAVSILGAVRKVNLNR